MSLRDVESRRRFLRFAASTAAVTVLASGLPHVARADDLAEVDPMAEAPGCVEGATESMNAEHSIGDACANCQFYTKRPEKPSRTCTFHSAASDLCW